MPDQPMEERIADALREHRYKVEQAVCSCSDFVQVGLRCDDQTHEQHVAAVVAGIVREAQAKALEDAADHLDPQTHINPDGTAKPTLDTVLMVATHATAPWLRQIARGIRNNGEGANHV